MKHSVEHRTVPLVDIAAQHRSLQEEIERAVLGVLESGKYILGETVAKFECEVAGYTGAKYAVGCASGTDALLLALMAFDVKAGDEIITTPFTFFATAASIARLGAKPVFVDIEPDTFNIDPEKLEKKITPKTRGIMPVHLFGQTANMDHIMATARKHGLFVIEDAAQAIGATYRGRQAGTIGDLGAFSFFPTKNLGCAGDGGLVTANDPGLAEKLTMLRVHGAHKQYFHKYVGINSRLDAIQAAILSVKLKRLDEWHHARRRHAALYHELFEGSKVRIPLVKPGNVSIFNQYVIQAHERDRLKEYLAGKGVSTFIYYPLSLSLQECFAYLGHKKGDFPVAEKATAEVLALPVAPELTEEDVRYVAAKVLEFYQ
ncbi:MAG TPA: DegT/DnrJ/EryC1/StrS family aminotransferase [bacterium]|nr:DegT/DnrJ/EryC1/StrS family aminotransferase [bacterium]